MNSNITLTQDQEKAKAAFFQFLSDPTASVFVLEGYAGCGKSTLIKNILEDMTAYEKAMALVDPKFRPYSRRFTATTNKAAENLASILKEPVQTIHSALGLRVCTDYQTQKTKLVAQRKSSVISKELIFIEEASFINSELLGHIFKRTEDCKIVFIGDPAQLAPVNCADTPVFSAGFPGARLTEVVRQTKNSPITDLATAFRHTVNTGEWPIFTPDGVHVQHLSREDFEGEIIKEFTRPDWHYHDSKVLAWTNKTVIEYNQAINEVVKGRPEFQVGDYAICNSFIYRDGISIKTDATVYIERIHTPINMYGVMGKTYLVNGMALFMPDNFEDKAKALKKAQEEQNNSAVQTITEHWIDLRAAYAQTVNKSQGSTYGKVFIDLDDLSKCNQGDVLARMLYVAVSRAKDRVYLTGDIS